MCDHTSATAISDTEMNVVKIMSLRHYVVRGNSPLILLECVLNGASSVPGGSVGLRDNWSTPSLTEHRKRT